MGTTAAAVMAAKQRAERDAADPAGAVARNQGRALASVILLALWGGAALLVVTTVAPAAFRVLPTRALAGALVGQVLPAVFVLGIVVAMASVALAAPGAPRMLARRIGAFGTLIGCLVAQGIIAPKIAALRVLIGPDIEALAATDPLRLAFGRLHGFSVLALGVAMVFALVALVSAVLAIRDARTTD